MDFINNSRQFLFSLIITYLIQSNYYVMSSNRHLYTKEENGAIDQFRPLAKKYLTLNYHQTDAYLLRWLRGSNLVIKEALTELKKYFGKWNIRQYSRSGKQKVIVRQYQRLYETAIRKAFDKAERQGRDLDQIYVLTDLAGYNFREHSCFSCIFVTLEYARTFAAGVIPFAKNVTLVNSPRIFEPVLNLARTIVTKVPIRDYSNDKASWMPKLFKDIHPDQLPMSFGGNTLLY